MIAYPTEAIDALISRFEKQHLPKSEWIHQAHLVVAIWYCWHYVDREALSLVRDLITKHNKSVGTPNNDSDGYHETITAFWLWVAKQYLNSLESDSVYDACNAFIASAYSSSKYPLVYYSSEQLFSVQARHNWVEPDLNPLETLFELA